MTTQRTTPASELSGSGWSNRILLAGVFGILFLTLYPFQFNWNASGHGNGLPFLLGHGTKRPHIRGDILNILLFVPFGFALSEKLWGNGRARAKTLLLVLVSGAFFSYGIEFIQFYIPPRDSGWDDVITNSMGAVVGFLAYAACGRPFTRFLSRFESNLDGWLTPPRLGWTLFVYFGVWFTISGFLQRETRVDNWDPNSRLVIGNEASGRPAYTWKGQVFSLQFWDRALPNDLARRVTAGEPSPDAQVGLIASYNFSGLTPFQDEWKFLPELFWIPSIPGHVESKAVVLDGSRWLTSGDSVPALVKEIEKSKQFSVRMVCAPAEAEGTQGVIVSISRGPGAVNFNLWQRGTNLAFWFRNELSVKRSLLAWYIPDVFTINQTRDILFSYNGSDLSLYINAQRNPHLYRLGPGTGMAQWLRQPRADELDGYNYIYYFLVFLPAGFILGIAARRSDWGKFKAVVPVTIGFMLPPFVLEHLLAAVSGRSTSSQCIALSLAVTIAAGLWANADRYSLAQTK